MLALDADSTGATAPRTRRKASHKRGQGVASQQAVQGLVGILSLGLQGASEVAATAAETPEIALLPGQTDKDAGEAEILALLPAQWMAKTAFGREVGKYLISDEHKAVALTLLAYLMRVGPPLYAKVQAQNVARRQNAAATRRNTPTQPPAAGASIPVGGGFPTSIIGEPPNVHAFGRRAATNGAAPASEQLIIPVPHL